ncbi:MAG: PIN domain-containing protein [Burkholderiaceae bacterium]
MFNVLIDTSVWLDLADKPQQTPLLDPIEGLLSYAGINLLVPQIVSDEFKRNRNRVAEKSTKGLATHFNLVKDAIRRSTGNKAQKAKVLQYLSDVDHKLPQVGGNAKLALDRIEKILDAMPKIPISDAAKVKAADRALNRLGPCHNNKNAMADALLIETYFECVRAGKKGDRFAFVTHNKIDFSLAGGDEKLPHKDLAAGFSKIKSLYFTNLGACLNRIEPAFVRDVLMELSFEEEPRDLSEILYWMDRLTTQVWHNRNMNTQWALDHGRHKIVTKAEWEAGVAKNKMFGQKHTVDYIWKGALKARAKAQRTLGEGNYGPYSDFEWGMINGKLSALRWALGEDWDELYT